MTPLILTLIPALPLLASMVVGVFSTKLGNNLLSNRKFAYALTSGSVAVACILSSIVLNATISGEKFDGQIYQWSLVDGVTLEIGFLIDRLSALMMVVVTFVSLMVHIYAIGYMEEDEGHNRFFAYISLFTFAMLMLVMSNNFLQLFFGWEAVGLVSYLLIGFWFKKPTAVFANMKAFIVNRVGDFGFILGIGLILAYTGTLNYGEVFANKGTLTNQFINGWEVITLACICLFIGAMGKSAQIPLHVWLPDSMEGPTPISALIHAATMVTAGIFMVARMSPLFELSDTTLSLMLIIGAVTALFMGLLGVIQNDIKRVIAYSTLSQLGYMTVALGASAYSVAIFHLMTHAFFKALLFLAAGSVIMGMHHEQDVRKMGGLRKYMPVTWLTFLIGSLALIGTPFLSGFYSKESIIEAVHVSQLYGATFAYYALLAGVFITAFYSFRLYYLVFHGKGDYHGHVPHESQKVVTIPLLLLAIPSIAVGFFTIDSIVAGDFFQNVIAVSPHHGAMAELVKGFSDPFGMAIHAFTTLPFYLALAGVIFATVLYLWLPGMIGKLSKPFNIIKRVLEEKYYFDWFNEHVLARGARALGGFFSDIGDKKIIDQYIVNGAAWSVGKLASISRKLQTGLVSWYALSMILGLLILLTYFLR